ncbi:LytR/AlgR family response regulator transcription factor [Pedobacter duraquae]|uniref:LytTR family two component transcriptional regulator n=1 Tax=Pedobacter duraquae TaxID=425511 RepID=A0A4R6IG55_9SPHI|nr:LytTR family DNA-binding domain-containing protein [Pedobacter duraquae]TDO20741.1 LytTR family two component transcriptional regulator [Pedobacter duraquae]
MAIPATKMTCLIVDDNPIARATLVQLASQIQDLEILQECDNAISAYNYLQQNDVQLVLLDIEMPEMSGLELTRSLGKKDFFIIFTTSKKEYAQEAFDLNVADYLVKPYAPHRFIQAINKVKDLIGSKDEDLELINDEFIFVRDSNIIRRLGLDDILYAEAMGDYVKFYTKDKLYAIHGTFKSVESRLPAQRFVRIHRSYIVSLRYIDTLQEGGVVIQGKFLPIADSYRKSLHKVMNIL